MAKESLRLDLRTALYQARQLVQGVSRRSLLLAEGDRPRPVQIDILPFQPETTDKHYYLVLFSDASTDEAAQTLPLLPSPALESEASDETAAIEQYRLENLALQQDLDTTRSHLQSIIQEQEATNQNLRAANEEILSSNEELQSTNEELQSATTFKTCSAVFTFRC